MVFFGLVYLVTTSLLLLFKREIDNSDESEQQIDFNLIDSYRVAWNIFTLGPIQKLTIILFSIRVIFTSNLIKLLNLTPTPPKVY